MGQTNNIIGIIPARAGSKRFPQKNRILIRHVIKNIYKSRMLDKIIITTDDKYIIDYVSKSYSKIIIDERPPELCKDDSSPYSVAKYIAEKYKIENDDIVVWLQPTSPLRDPTDIDNTIIKMYKENIDSIVSVCKICQEPGSMVDSDGKYICIKKQDNLLYFINGSVYALKWGVLKLFKKFYIQKITGFYVMPKYRSIDVDDSEDYETAHLIMRGGHK